MERCIDADKLVRDAREQYCKHCENPNWMCRTCRVHFAINLIDSAQPECALWIKHGNLLSGFGYFSCSNCNRYIEPIEVLITKFCPGCGREMKRTKENKNG